MSPADLVTHAGRGAYLQAIDGDQAVILQHGCNPQVVPLVSCHPVPRGLEARISDELAWRREGD